MRVGYILPAETAQRGGVQRFATSLQERLGELVELFPLRIHPRLGESRVGGLVSGLQQLRRLQPLDAVFSTFHYPPSVFWDVPMVGFIHDVRLWQLHRQAGSERRSRNAARAIVLRGVMGTWARILVPTRHVAEDVQWLLPGRTVVAVGEGVDHLPDVRTEAAARLVVFAGRAPHKRGPLGVEAALRAARRMGLEVVVIGDFEEAAYSNEPLLRHAGTDLNDLAMAKLLSSARAVILPSAYEGFGLAAGEALRAGAPVVYASDCPMYDVVGDAGSGAAPNPDALADALVRVIGRPELRELATQQAARWTWATTAARVHEQLQDVVAKRGRVRRYF
jgi:glycosyltransferase involved in cell wall biosynthesis